MEGFLYWYEGVNTHITAVKAATAAMGYGDNYVRLPLTTMEPENEAKMLELMREQGIDV